MTEKNKKKTIIIHQQFLKLCSKIRKKVQFRKFYLIQLYRFFPILEEYVSHSF